MKNEKYFKIFLIILFFYLPGIIITFIHEIGHLIWGYLNGCKDASIIVYPNFHGLMTCSDLNFKSAKNVVFASSGFVSTTIVGIIAFTIYRTVRYKKNYLISLFLFLLSFFSLSSLIYIVPVDSLLMRGDIVDILDVYHIDNVLLSTITFIIFLPLFYFFIKEFPMVLKNMKVIKKGEERESIAIFMIFIATMIILMLSGF
jgi:hypothetical protein